MRFGWIISPFICKNIHLSIYLVSSLSLCGLVDLRATSTTSTRCFGTGTCWPLRCFWTLPGTKYTPESIMDFISCRMRCLKKRSGMTWSKRASNSIPTVMHARLRLGPLLSSETFPNRSRPWEVGNGGSNTGDDFRALWSSHFSQKRHPCSLDRSQGACARIRRPWMRKRLRGLRTCPLPKGRGDPTNYAHSNADFR